MQHRDSDICRFLFEFTYPETSLTISLTNAVLLLKCPFMRETLGFGWRGVTFCTSQLCQLRCQSSRIMTAFIAFVREERVAHTWPALRPTAMPDFCLTSFGILTVIVVDVAELKSGLTFAVVVSAVENFAGLALDFLGGTLHHVIDAEIDLLQKDCAYRTSLPCYALSLASCATHNVCWNIRTIAQKTIGQRHPKSLTSRAGPVGRSLAIKVYACVRRLQDGA